MFLRQLYTISDKGSLCILSEFGLRRYSNADCQQPHTDSTTCSNTVTFFTVPTNNVSICFVFIISQRYQRLTLYSLEYDC